MYKPRKRLDVGTWGGMGIGMAIRSRRPWCAASKDRRRRRQRVRFSGMEVETICRCQPPVCVVILNNNGAHGDEVNPTEDAIRRRSFSSRARLRKLMDAFGGVGVLATTPAEPRRDGRGNPLAQADADQRGHRREGGHGKRPHHEPQSHRRK
jgi:oxalyl-CoA decarboxylase